MSDLIQLLSDGLDVIIFFIKNVVENANALCNALITIYTGLTSSSVMFPSFLAGLIIACCSILFLLRIMGR